MKTWISVFSSGMTILFFATAPALAAEKSSMLVASEKKPAAPRELKFGERPGEKILQKALIGTVGYYDNKYMALIHEPEGAEKNVEYEIGFNLDKKVELIGYKKLSDIIRGHKIKVFYEEYEIESEEVKPDGSKVKNKKTDSWKAKKIQFMNNGNAQDALRSE